MEIKESILQAGATLLREQGIASLTQPKVSRAAGVKQSHLTYYFPRRSDLLLGIAEHTFEAVTTELAARLQKESLQDAFLHTVTSAMLEGLPPRILLGLVVAADGEPQLRAPLRKFIRHVRGRIQTLLARAGVGDSPASALQLHATLIGLAVLHEAQRTNESAGELKQGLAATLQLLGAAPPQPPRGQP